MFAAIQFVLPHRVTFADFAETGTAGHLMGLGLQTSFRFVSLLSCYSAIVIAIPLAFKRGIWRAFLIAGGAFVL